MPVGEERAKDSADSVSSLISVIHTKSDIPETTRYSTTWKQFENYMMQSDKSQIRSITNGFDPPSTKYTIPPIMCGMTESEKNVKLN